MNTLLHGPILWNALYTCLTWRVRYPFGFSQTCSNFHEYVYTWIHKVFYLATKYTRFHVKLIFEYDSFLQKKLCNNFIFHRSYHDSINYCIYLKWCIHIPRNTTIFLQIIVQKKEETMRNSLTEYSTIWSQYFFTIYNNFHSN